MNQSKNNNIDRIVSSDRIIRCGNKVEVYYAGTIETGHKFLFFTNGAYNVYDHPNPKIIVDRSGIRATRQKY